MLRQISSARQSAESLRDELGAKLAGVADRLFDWSPAERAFLDRLHEEGKVDAAALHADLEVRQSVEVQPMLLWKAQNVRAHLAEAPEA